MLPGTALKPSRQSKLSSLLKRTLQFLIIIAATLTVYLWQTGYWSGSGNQTAQADASAAGSAHDVLRRSALPADTLRTVIKTLDADVAHHLLPEDTDVPDTSFKNPCWRSNDGKLKCLPYAHILGGFQSGAGTLYQKLSAHPDIILTGSSRNQFWAEQGKSAAQFASDNSRVVTNLQASPDKRITIEGSASTFGFYWSAGLRAHAAFQHAVVPCVQNCSHVPQGMERQTCLDGHCYPRAMAADLQVAQSLHVHYDDLHLPAIISAVYGTGPHKPKMIAVLRNPVDRLHSAFYGYAHYQKYGHTPEGFLAYVKEQVGAIKECAKRHTGKKADPGDGSPMSRADAERHCLLYFEALGSKEEAVFFHADQIIRGTYSVFLEIWMRYFPLNEQLLIIKSEEYFADQKSTLSQVYKFLGLEEPTNPSVAQKIFNAGQPVKAKDRPSMLPQARKILKEFYKPYNNELHKLLGNSKWLAYNKN